MNRQRGQKIQRLLITFPHVISAQYIERLNERFTLPSEMEGGARRIKHNQARREMRLRFRALSELHASQ